MFSIASAAHHFRILILFAIGLITVGATSDAQETGSSISADSLEKLDEVVANYIKLDLAVGAELLVIQNDEILLHTSHGFSDKAEEEVWKNDTLCNIRSMTKSITSAAAQLLVDRGELILDDPVAKYLESFDNDKSDGITVRQVLTHRAGFPLTNLFHPRQYKSLAEQVDSSGEKGPSMKPGEKFSYSDSGTDVVGRLIEKVSGESLDEFVVREILSPLKMTDSFYGIDKNEERLENVASLYAGRTKKWNRYWRPRVKPLYPFAWGSQTLYSTTTDYAKFLAMMANNGRVGDRQLLSEAAVQRMLEPISLMTMPGSDSAAPTGFRNVKTYYGQMMVTHREVDSEDKPISGMPQILGHSGSDGTNSWAWPERGIVVLYFTQSRGGTTPMRIEEFIDRFLIHPGAEAEEIPDRLAPFVGRYIANFKQFEDEEMTVRVRDGKLILDVPSQRAFELLEPDEAGQWAFALVPDKIKVSFILDAEDNVVGLRLHQGESTFEVPRLGHTLSESSEDK